MRFTTEIYFVCMSSTVKYEELKRLCVRVNVFGYMKIGN